VINLVGNFQDRALNLCLYARRIPLVIFCASDKSLFSSVIQRCAVGLESLRPSIFASGGEGEAGVKKRGFRCLEGSTLTDDPASSCVT
jgi:hypothetical protein